MNDSSLSIQKKVRNLENFARTQSDFRSSADVLWVAAGLLVVREAVRRAAARSVKQGETNGMSLTWERVSASLVEYGGMEVMSLLHPVMARDYDQNPGLDSALERLLQDFGPLSPPERWRLLELLDDFDWDEDRSQAPQEVQQFLTEATSTLLGSRAEKAQFFTPAPVAQLMVEIAAPQPGETIYDPCFGSGSLLLRCAQYTQQRQGGTASTQTAPTLCGSEVNPQVFALGFAQLFLAGAGFQIRNQDTLKHRDSLRLFGQKFDLVVAALPFGGRVGFQEDEDGNRLQTAEASVLFLQHVMASLAPGGRAVVCCAEGLLFRGGFTEKVREQLLREFDLESVVSLPSGTFQPYTGVKASLLVFRRATSSGIVRFLESPTLQGTGGRLARETEAVPPEEVAARLNGTSSDRLWSVSVEQLLKNNADLNARRYAPVATEEFADVETVRLSEVAEIWRGTPYRSEGLVDAASLTTLGNRGLDPVTREPLVGLIRIAELQEGRRIGVRSPQVFAPPSLLSKNTGGRTLREGDVLVTAIGSRVKVARVGREAAGTLATLNLFVLRVRDQLAADYLVTVLRSRRFAAWFASHAVGSTVQRLATSDLADFPVPMAPREVQEEIARRFESSGQDADFLLASWRDDQDQGFLWPSLLGLESQTGLADFEATDSESALRFLGQFSREFAPLRDRMTSQTIGVSDALDLDWVTALEPATLIWSDIEAVPPSSTRLWLLERASSALRSADLLLQERSLPSIEAKRRFVKALQTLNRKASDDLFETVRVEIDIEPKSIEAGQENEVFLRVQNLSPLPLRGFGIFSPRLQLEQEIPFLAEGSTHRFPLTLPPIEGDEVLEFATVWDATRLDGQNADGVGTVGLSVVASKEEVWPDLGSNPYINGSPIEHERQDMVFGREELLSKVRSQLSQRQSANVFFFIGNRRAGKTTLLKQLSSEPPSDWVVAFTSLQKSENPNEDALPDNREVFRVLATAILDALQEQGIELAPPVSDFQMPPLHQNPFIRQRQLREALNRAFIETERPFGLLDEYLRAALAALAPRRLLLMVDEFDKLSHSIRAQVATTDVPDNLRYLLQKYPGFTAIIAGSHRLRELSAGYWTAFFGLGPIETIGCISKEAAQKLVTQPVEGRIRWSAEARDEVVRLCSGHAYLIQGFCSQIFGCVERTGNRFVTAKTVAVVAEEILGAHPFFQGLWEDAESERRRLLMAICARFTGAPEQLTLEFLLDQLEGMGIDVPVKKAVGDDLKFLRNLGVLRQEHGVHSVAIPLLVRWLNTQQDLSAQKEAARQEAETLR